MSYENLFQCYECDSNKHENCTENKSGEAVFCGPEQIGCLIARGQTCFFLANSASFGEDRCQAMSYDLLGKEEKETLILYLESGPQGDHFYRGCSTMGEGARCVDRTEGTMVRKSVIFSWFQSE